MFVAIAEIERAGWRDLPVGQRIVFEVRLDKRAGKISAVNLRAG